MIFASGVSTGVGISRARVFKKTGMKMACCNSNNIDTEMARVDYCINSARNELESICASMIDGTEEKAANIFNKYISIINNPYLLADIKNKISYEGFSAEYAVASIMEGFSKVVKELDDEYLCEKSEDIDDIKCRLLRKLGDYKFENYSGINEECVVVAEDITPSDVLNMNPSFVKGIVTINGGPTSSVGAMARYVNIPAVTGVGHEGYYIKNDDLLIVDGNNGKVIVNPDHDELTVYTSGKK